MILDRVFRKLLPQDVEVAAVVRNIDFYHFTLEFVSYYKYIVNLILGGYLIFLKTFSKLVKA